MEITKTLYVTNRKDWRKWLLKNHDKEKEIWLIYYRKDSQEPRIPYNDAVEEALCFGWIDSQQKGIDKTRFAQRFSPRKPKSAWSQMNKERVRRLVDEGRMTKVGLAVFPGDDDKFKIPPDILRKIKADKVIGQNFQGFPESYKRIRVAFIEGARSRPEEFKKRLNYFLKMTKQGKKFGMVQ